MIQHVAAELSDRFFIIHDQNPAAARAGLYFHFPLRLDLLIRSREMNISGRPRARFRLDAQVSAVTSDYRIAGRQPQAAGFSFDPYFTIKDEASSLLRYPHP